MLSKDTIIRAWKDAAFRETLSEQERALLPVHPAGLVLLTDDELNSVAGGGRTTLSSPHPWECPKPI
jgi:mersacidin/lichenicidin family type 2 lantibiotic